MLRSLLTQFLLHDGLDIFQHFAGGVILSYNPVQLMTVLVVIAFSLRPAKADTGLNVDPCCLMFQCLII